jgi:hypothetical protein
MKPSDSQVGGAHYKGMPIQPAEFIHKNEIGFLEGNVIKYVCRHATKNGKADLLKARHYIDLLLEWQYGDDGQTVPAGKPLTFKEIPWAGEAPPTQVRCRCGWEGTTDKLNRAVVRAYPFCPDCGLDFKPVEGELTQADRDAGLLPDHAPAPVPCAHGFLVCKVCDVG